MSHPRMGRRLAAWASLALTACSVVTEDVATGEAPLTSAEAFPADFQFGTAIAGFQVDMGCPTLPAAVCEDRRSDWYQYVTTDRIVHNPLLHMSGDAPSTGPGFYETYANDLSRAASTGADGIGSNALRLSIEWSRIFPEPTWGVSGQENLAAIASADGIAFYHRVLAEMRRRGLKPSVTLNHYSLPLWVHDANMCNQSLDWCIREGKGGWADPDRPRITNEIAKYAGFVAKEFGAEIDLWATLNEPFSAAVFPGYLFPTQGRSAPPGLYLAIDAAKTATVAMIEAHARMYDAVKANDLVDADGDGKNAEVGIVYAFSDIVPLTGNDQDRRAAANAQYILHDLFMDGVALGRVDEDWQKGPGADIPVRADLANRLDFVGVNYYFRFSAQSAIPLPFLSWHLDFNPMAPLEPKPMGIKPVILRVAARYGKPIYVTETGTLQDDQAAGAAWVAQTIGAVRSAMSEGADVRGYYAWTLMDNYEWNQGTHTKMGFYGVDPGTKERTIRESGQVFARIAREKRVAPELQQRYAAFFE